VGRRPKTPSSPYDPGSEQNKPDTSRRRTRAEAKKFQERMRDYRRDIWREIQRRMDEINISAGINRHGTNIVGEVDVADFGRYQLRGCGDPQCDACNSHIPTEVRSVMPRSPVGGTPTYPGGEMPIVSFDTNNSPGYQRFIRSASMGVPSGPPASYTEARKNVEQYLLTTEQDTGWDDVIGNDEAKEALLEAIEEPVRNPALYAYYGMKPPKGIILYGPPGCGKTMFAKASAAAMGRIYNAKVDVIVINGAELESPFVGVVEARIGAIFKYAREYKKYHGHPMIIFIDEAEVLLPDRTGRKRPVSSWEQSRVASFLGEMDGIESLGAFVILATNRPEQIDEALMRDGRCDRKIKVVRPTQAVTEVILRKTLKGVPLAADTTLDELVMAASESFFNPHYVLTEGSVVHGFLSEKGEPQIETVQSLNFCLEHIVNGAMAVGVAARAKSRAFRRDREANTVTGIKLDDVLGAVREIFEENKKLEHSFALQEFMEAIPIKEMVEAHEAKKAGPKGHSGLN
jgi:DNA polymerase III delta prime subunit